MSVPSPKIIACYPELARPICETGQEVIIGLGAFGHDAAAAMINAKTGQVLYAVAEERLTNRKHDWHYPVGAIHKCCQEAVKLNATLTGVAVNFQSNEFVTKTLFGEIDEYAGVVGADTIKTALIEHLNEAEYFSLKTPNNTTHFVSNLLTEFGFDEASMRTLLKRISWYYNWSIKYRDIEKLIRQHFLGFPIHTVNHHLSHAASAFYSSGFEDATVLVMDGSGEADTVTVYRGRGNHLELVSQTGWPHSLGIFYLMATQHLGFGLGDEYKVMGMSAYGEPRFEPQLRDLLKVSNHAVLMQQQTPLLSLRDLSGTGHIVFQFTDEMNRLIPTRQKSDPVTQIHFDFAASIQKLTEDTGVELAKQAINLTGHKNIAIAGGVGLNGLMNEAIRKRSGCDEIFVYPAAGDDGCAVGAAQWLAAQHQKLPKLRLRSCYFGHDVLRDETLSLLSDREICFSKPRSIHKQIAEALAEGKIVARCYGRSEFGPRALGNRSILAHPGIASMKETLNLRVKHREEFRPFAPACLKDRVSEYFEIDMDSPFMLLITKATLLAKNQVPSVVHADGTARVQSVSKCEHSDFYEVIVEFEKLTGLPIVLNTSFNVNGETIVDTAMDALESFGFMDIDFLALGPFWISKSENTGKFPELSHEDYLKIRQNRFLARNLGFLSEVDISIFDDAFLDVDKPVDAFLESLLVDQCRTSKVP